MALGAGIDEMEFSGQIGMDISRNDRVWVRLQSFSTCIHTVLVAEDALFPDPADRFLDVGDAH